MQHDSLTWIVTVPPGLIGGLSGYVNTAWGDRDPGPGRAVEAKMRMLSKKIHWSSPLFKRLDRIAADLNVVLVVFAVGLATLDLTFLVTQRVIERLPQVTRVTWDAAPPATLPGDAAQHK